MLTKEDISIKLSELMLSAVENLVSTMTDTKSSVLEILLCKTVLQTLKGATAKEFSQLLDRVTGKPAEEIVVNTDFDTLSIEELSERIQALSQPTYKA